MTTEQYLAYCDTIEDIQLANTDIFEGRKPSRIIRLERFFWPSEGVQLRENSVFGYQEPGAYIEVYDIFAVNTVTRVAWAMYVSGDIDKYEEQFTADTFLLPQSKLDGVFNAMESIMNSDTGDEGDDNDEDSEESDCSCCSR